MSRFSIESLELRQLLAVVPNANPIVRPDHVVVVIMQDRFDDAIRLYRVARTLRADYVAVPVNLGNILLELNRLDEARESFNAALELDKNNAAAHYGLGQIAASQRK